ncbi:MAG: YCF48-related protein [Desulfobacteraceae bacterium]
MRKMLCLPAACLTVICWALPAMVFGAAVKDVLDRPAMKVTDPVHTVLLDVTRAGSRLVAVGERGVVIFSDDAGDTWHQADVPVSATLTGVAFPTPDQGWAVGHSGVVLHTTDGGRSWHGQLDGVAAARMALETARAAAAHSPSQDKAANQLVKNAELLVADGADKPFLDLYFENDREGMVIGAYGLIFNTTDGGQSWQCLMDRVENPRGLHLYAIRASGDHLYIAGEQGLFLVSSNMDHSFRQMQTPYKGTFFDLAVTSSGDVVIVGLRGNAYWSSDQGTTFNPTKVPVEVSFTAAGHLKDGTLLFANQAGMLLASRDGGRTLQMTAIPRLAPISAFIPTGNGDLITVGYGGAIRVQLPQPGSKHKGGHP